MCIYSVGVKYETSFAVEDLVPVLEAGLSQKDGLNPLFSITYIAKSNLCRSKMREFGKMSDLLFSLTELVVIDNYKMISVDFPNHQFKSV